MKRPQGLMAFDTFTKILDEVGGYIFTLLFWGWGEPFLNPRAFDMIAYARAKGIKVISSTNGHLFARQEFADPAARSGLDSIIFAIDGVTQASYERFRHGGRLETVLQGIRNVADRKKALGSKTPLINFRFIVMAQNEAEIPLVKKLAPSVGADALTFKTLNPEMKTFICRLSSETSEGKMLMPRETHYRRFRIGPRGEPRVYRRRNPCKHLWNNPVIHWDGTVVSCSFDPCELIPSATCGSGASGRSGGGGLPGYAPPVPGQLVPDAALWRLQLCLGGRERSHEVIAESIFYGNEMGNGGK